MTRAKSRSVCSQLWAGCTAAPRPSAPDRSSVNSATRSAFAAPIRSAGPSAVQSAGQMIRGRRRVRGTRNRRHLVQLRVDGGHALGDGDLEDRQQQRRHGQDGRQALSCGQSPQKDKQAKPGKESQRAGHSP